MMIHVKIYVTLYFNFCFLESWQTSPPRQSGSPTAQTTFPEALSGNLSNVEFFSLDLFKKCLLNSFVIDYRPFTF